MKLTYIEAINWTVHECFRLRLPDAGVVIVRGPNGSGKSSGTIEAVSTALWGRGVRKRNTKALLAGTMLTVRGAGFEVVRKPRSLVMRGSSGDPTLSGQVNTLEVLDPVFNAPIKNRLQPIPLDEGLTATKEQERVEAHLGSWDAWRKANVFTRSDVSDFGKATDAERKRYLESVLGVHIFDEASDTLREEATRCEAASLAAVTVHERAKDALEAANEGLLAAESEQRDLPVLGPEPVALPNPSAELHALRIAMQDAEAAAQRAQRTVSTQRQSYDRAIDRVGFCFQQVDEYTPDRVCKACHQDVKTPPERAQEERARLEAALQAAEFAEYEQQDALAQALDALDPLLIRARETSEAYNTAAASLGAAFVAARERDQAIAAWRELRAKHAATKKLVERAHTIKARAVEEERSAEAARAVTRRACEVVVYARDVVGLRGVRARILERLVATVGELSNVWLKRLGPPDLQLVLAVDGQAREAITLTITKPSGETLDYSLLSSGEQKRVDFALLFALGGVGEREDSTMFFDEVFDSLDADGREVIVNVIRELARTRCVVVISHEPTLIDALPEAEEVELKAPVRPIASAVRRGPKKEKT